MIDLLLHDMLHDMFQESGFRYPSFVTPIVIGGIGWSKFIEQFSSFHEAAEQIA